MATRRFGSLPDTRDWSRRRLGTPFLVQSLRFLLAVVAGLRAVFVYGEASAMTSEPWALRTAQRIVAALRWTPRTAPERAVGEPARVA